ncbi:Retrovirus-related Pol polyprotein from type-1 retrotransposable element R1 4, partial [Eumeta japonica]
MRKVLARGRRRASASTQCPAEDTAASLNLVTKAYRTVSTAALRFSRGCYRLTWRWLAVAARRIGAKVGLRLKLGCLGAEPRRRWLRYGRRDWDEEKNGRGTISLPDVSARLSFDWVEPDYQTSQLLTGHGCFRKRLYELGLNETSVCLCGQTDEDMHHVLWSCPLYDDFRSDMLSGIKVLQVGPVYYADLVGTRANFR